MNATTKKAEALRAALTKKFGDKAVMMASEMPPTNFCTSGSLALDFAIGRGAPTGRVIELIGKEGAGKTTLALLMLAERLRADPTRLGMYMDMEHKLAATWMETLVGPEVMSRLMYVSPDHAEEATDIYSQALRTGDIAGVIYDSIGGAPVAAVHEKSAEDVQVAGNAGPITKFARLAANLSAKYECQTIGVNQMRVTIGGGPGAAHAINAPGGHGWRHACITRVLLQRNGTVFTDKIGGTDVRVGFGVKARVFKNQTGFPENRTAEWNMFTTATEKYGPVGIDTTDEVVRLSTLTDVVETLPGGYYNHPAFAGGKIRGKDTLREVILGDEKLRKRLADEVLAAVTGNDELFASIAPVDDSDLGEIADEQFGQKMLGKIDPTVVDGMKRGL